MDNLALLWYVESKSNLSFAEWRVMCWYSITRAAEHPA
jgi:hypothetical protein